MHNSYAIPVTTKSVADFLGFGYAIRNTDNPHGKYSENEIYQHITNCQTFMSYNADETKLFRRRKDFKASLEVLYNLTANGDIYGWSVSRMLSRRSNTNPMTKLGHEIAARLQQRGRSQATCISHLVLIGLHSAYNTVLAVSHRLEFVLRFTSLTHLDSSLPFSTGSSRTYTIMQTPHRHQPKSLLGLLCSSWLLRPTRTASPSLRTFFSKLSVLLCDFPFYEAVCIHAKLTVYDTTKVLL